MKCFRMMLVALVLLWASAVSAKDVLLVFTASWCAPCQAFKKDLKEDPGITAGVATEVFDIEVAKEMAKDFGVKSFPTFVLVSEDENGVLGKNGEKARQVGYEGPRKLRRWIEKNR